tara:strand:- start:454 stop:600 length:147 start_codon:yes stop_codon:yes gene_type:complete
VAVVAARTAHQQVALAALALLFFPFQPLNTQAQPQVHQQLQPAVQTQF